MLTQLPLLLSLLLCGTSAASSPEASAAAEPAALQGRSKKAEALPVDCTPEFLALNNEWLGAVDEYKNARRKFDRSIAGLPAAQRDLRGKPVHPAARFWSRFEALGKVGDPYALVWLVVEAPFSFEKPEQQMAAAEHAFDALLEKHAEHLVLEKALTTLGEAHATFGFPRLVALFDRAANATKNPENQGRALFQKAWALTERYQNPDPKLRAQMQEIHHTILLTCPGTRSALETTGHVYPPLQREFLQSELRWIDEVRALQQQRKDPKDWPRQPMHAWHEQCLVIAAAGGPEAQEMVNNIYPAYQQAEGNGIEHGLAFLVGYWDRKGIDPEGWTRARLGLLEIVTRQFHEKPVVTDALGDLAKFPVGLPLKYLEPALQPILADETNARAHAFALYILAMARREQNQSADWEAARALFEELLRKHPTEQIVTRASERLNEIINVWPGRQAPDFRGTDQDGKAFTLGDYKGYVVVIDFVGTAGGMTPDEVARRSALVKQFEGRPFRWIGGLIDAYSQSAFRDTLNAAGVNWRCALLSSIGSDIASLWSVLKAPESLVIDAQGVIRSRNLPWDAQRELIAKLVAEAEAKNAGK